MKLLLTLWEISPVKYVSDWWKTGKNIYMLFIRLFMYNKYLGIPKYISYLPFLPSWSKANSRRMTAVWLN